MNRTGKTTWKQKLARIIRDEQGATMLEWGLLLAVIALPTWAFIRAGLTIMASHYELVSTMNQMPFP